MSPSPVLSLSNVSFSYGTAAPVFDGVDLAIQDREFVSVVGPNGGGKTTLLKLLLGLLRPDAGEVRVFGVPAPDARRRVGYMPQYAHYDPKFPVTVRDVVLMGRVERHAVGFYSRQDRRAADEALAQVGLADLAERLFEALSGGQRQRVLLARALATEPDLLLLDEPTANVDAAVESKLFEILKELNTRMTILIVSHDLGFVSEIVQSVVCVHNDLVVHPTSALTGDLIRDMYGGDVRMVRHDHRCSEEGHSHG